MIWFRENWYEELLRQLNEGLSLCQAAAFESRADGRCICSKSTVLPLISTWTLYLYAPLSTLTHTHTNTHTHTPVLSYCIAADNGHTTHAHTHTHTFTHSHTVTNARISPEMMQFVHKLVSTFGISLEQSGLASTGNVGGALSQEMLAKRAQAAAQDPAFQRLKAQFASDFDFSAPGAKRLHNLMSKLKRWIKILELKTKSLQEYDCI